MSCIKSIKLAKTPGCPEGFIKRGTGVKSNIYKATLDIVLAHVADFYEVMLTVMCEKYGIPMEEALAAVLESPQMKEMRVSPEFRGLSYVEEADVEKTAVRGLIKKLFGEDEEPVEALSPPVSGSLSPPVEKAASAAKKRGRPSKKIIIVEDD
jgi:hypothetical protein